MPSNAPFGAGRQDLDRYARLQILAEPDEAIGPLCNGTKQFNVREGENVLGR